MQLRFHPYTLQLRHPFTLGNQTTRTSTPIVLTEIEHHGIVGYGEASMPPYLGESHESVMAFLAKVDLSSFQNPVDREEILNYVDHIAEGNPAAKASVDIALHDLMGKWQDQSCATLFNADKNRMKPTACTIGIDSADVIKQKIREAEEFLVLKIKLGTAQDRELIQTVRSETDKPLYVDVNQGWKNKEAALEIIEWLSTQNVLFVEQPLPAESIDDAAWLSERSALPIIADEACRRLADVENMSGMYHGINIKLMKCTGMYEAKKMIDKANQLGLKTLLGCMTETSCATMAAAALAPLVDWVDLDGPWLITNNPFNDPMLLDGKIILTDLPGLGLQNS